MRGIQLGRSISEKVLKEQDNCLIDIARVMENDKAEVEIAPNTKVEIIRSTGVQSLVNNQTQFLGINELNITNSILNWDTSTNHTLKIWKTESTSHEFDNRNLSHLAVDYMEINHEQSQLNLTDWLDNWTGRLIFTLESDGIRVLTSLSQSPTGDMDFNSEDQTTGILSKFDDSPKLAVMVFIALFVALLPALVMWKGLQNMNSDESE